MTPSGWAGRPYACKVRLRVTQTFAHAPGAAAIAPRTVSNQILTFKARKRHKHHH